jgi:hypothetical protein
MPTAEVIHSRMRFLWPPQVKFINRSLRRQFARQTIILAEIAPPFRAARMKPIF